MSNELETTVDDLSKPGNEEALNSALNEGFGVNPNPIEEPQNEDPANKDLTPPEKKDPPTDPPADPPAGDPPTDPPTDPPEDPGNKDPQPSKADKVADLLKGRNEAADAAADKDNELTVANKKIEDLETEVDKLKTGDNGEGKDPSADDEITPKNIGELIKKGVNEALADRDGNVAAEKSNIAEVDALSTQKGFEGLKGVRDDVLTAMTKLPNTSARMIYRAMQGEGLVEGEGEPGSNSEQLNTGVKPKNNLVRDKKPGDMTPEEEEKYLRGEVEAGRIQL